MSNFSNMKINNFVTCVNNTKNNIQGINTIQNESLNKVELSSVEDQENVFSISKNDFANIINILQHKNLDQSIKNLCTPKNQEKVFNILDIIQNKLTESLNDLAQELKNESFNNNFNNSLDKDIKFIENIEHLSSYYIINLFKNLKILCNFSDNNIFLKKIAFHNLTRLFDKYKMLFSASEIDKFSKKMPFFGNLLKEEIKIFDHGFNFLENYWEKMVHLNNKDKSIVIQLLLSNDLNKLNFSKNFDYKKFPFHLATLSDNIKNDGIKIINESKKIFENKKFNNKIEKSINNIVNTCNEENSAFFDFINFYNKNINNE
ncbi:hypothetical protein [Buchnera aphidicola]|uniref:hypothetical protein n=1 Tax=Buchnera aphidicola TaxID=9 RepID=UPI0030ECC5F0